MALNRCLTKTLLEAGTDGPNAEIKINKKNTSLRRRCTFTLRLSTSSVDVFFKKNHLLHENVNNMTLKHQNLLNITV